jgi:hypothetical protein|nr:MAG TPA: 8-oxoguanine DNA glycosylase [Caudoviricetes sp.]
MIAITVPGFSLDYTFNAQQSFMWRKVFTYDGHCYIVVNKQNACRISQVKDRILISGSEEDFFDVWFKYFDLDVDYTTLDRACRSLGYIVSKASRLAYGVHMLNIDPVESMLTQLLWWKCDSYRAKNELKLLCSVAGTRKSYHYNGIGAVDIAFVPTLGQLKANEELLNKVLTHSVASKVMALAKLIESRPGLLDASKRFDLFDIVDWLEESKLFHPRQIARILRDAYGFRERLCAAKRIESKVLQSSICDTEEEWSWLASEKLGANVAYAGLLAQSAIGV